jgi:hypothetical protein
MAVVRYATAAAAGRIRQIYEQRLPACQPVLVAYFVRADPEYAGSLFGHRWDMLQNPPPCTISIFRTTPAFAMGPVLERYLTAYLFHRGVSLKDAAATSLSRYGSAAARDPLWEAFRHFHRYWKGREEALAQNHEGVHFEFTLRRSIAHGRKWVTSKQDLETLAALCITARCREETQRELQAAWQDAVAVRAMGSAASFYGQAAHYSELRSLEELLAKVRQFPAGTRIRIAVGGGQALEWEDRIRRAAQEAGLTVAP